MRKCTETKSLIENQGTTTDSDRFEKGLAFQVNAYGERINKMRNSTPDDKIARENFISSLAFYY